MLPTGNAWLEYPVTKYHPELPAPTDPEIKEKERSLLDNVRGVKTPLLDVNPRLILPVLTHARVSSTWNWKSVFPVLGDLSVRAALPFGPAGLMILMTGFSGALKLKLDVAAFPERSVPVTLTVMSCSIPYPVNGMNDTSYHLVLRSRVNELIEPLPARFVLVRDAPEST